MLDTSLSTKLLERQSSGLLRELVIRNGLVDFTSNDYLGLAASDELFKNIHEKILQLGVVQNGSGGSRLLSGNTTYVEEVESTLSHIFKSESSLIFNSGYTANLSVLSAVPERNDTILYDELSHASIKDGARLSLAQRLRFRHNDLGDLESKIKKASGKIFIVVESIYSMNGDECPLPGLVALAKQYDATIILDEAHSTGSYGPGGSGMAVSLGLEKDIGIRIYTFGKAMGVHGACVAGSRTLQRFLINYARPFIYTTALPAHSIAAIDYAFRYLERNIHLQKSLHQKIDVYAKCAHGLAGQRISKTAIQTIILPGNDNVKAIARALQGDGFDVRPILSPTVPVGSERLRICLHTFNSNEQIGNLAAKLEEVIRSEGK